MSNMDKIKSLLVAGAGVRERQQKESQVIQLLFGLFSFLSSKMILINETGRTQMLKKTWNSRIGHSDGDNITDDAGIKKRIR